MLWYGSFDHLARIRPFKFLDYFLKSKTNKLRQTIEFFFKVYANQYKFESWVNYKFTTYIYKMAGKSTPLSKALSLWEEKNAKPASEA